MLRRILNVERILLTNKLQFDMIHTGDSVFVESLSGRMRRGLKAHLRRVVNLGTLRYELVEY